MMGNEVLDKIGEMRMSAGNLEDRFREISMISSVQEVDFGTYYCFHERQHHGE